MINHAKFCGALTHAPYSLGDKTRAERAGYLLDAAAAHDPKMDLRWLAYELATALWETEYTLLPIREVGEGRGHPYGVKDPSTGQVYYGRGYVQTTWKANYAKVGKLIGQDLVHHPDLLLRPKYAAPALIVAMEEGIYTGKKLSDYFNARIQDPVGARRIVNGQDHARDISGFYHAFLTALQEAA
jgi:putative chitinase